MMKRSKDELIEANAGTIKKRRVAQGLPPEETAEEKAEKERKKKEAQDRVSQMQKEQQ